MKRREALGLDLTPLIDVVFILIIFFIVSSTFKDEKAILNLTLPSSQGENLKIEKKQISLELSKDALAYDGKKIDFITLQNKLENIKDKQKPIIVNIDSSVPYNRVVELLNILQLNELNNLALVTNPKK